MVARCGGDAAFRSKRVPRGFGSHEKFTRRLGKSDQHMTFRRSKQCGPRGRSASPMISGLGNGGADEERVVLFLDSHSAALRTPGSSSGLCQTTSRLRSCSSTWALSTLSSNGPKLNRSPYAHGWFVLAGQKLDQLIEIRNAQVEPSIEDSSVRKDVVVAEQTHDIPELRKRCQGRRHWHAAGSRILPGWVAHVSSPNRVNAQPCPGRRAIRHDGDRTKARTSQFCGAV